MSMPAAAWEWPRLPSRMRATRATTVGSNAIPWILTTRRRCSPGLAQAQEAWPAAQAPSRLPHRPSSTQAASSLARRKRRRTCHRRPFPRPNRPSMPGTKRGRQRSTPATTMAPDLAMVPPPRRSTRQTRPSPTTTHTTEDAIRPSRSTTSTGETALPFPTLTSGSSTFASRPAAVSSPRTCQWRA